MKNSKRKFIYFSLFAIISCANVSNYCKHNTSLSKNHFGFKSNSEKQERTNVYHFSSQISSIKNETAQLLTWEELSAVSYTSKFNKQYQMDFQYPVFGKKVKALEGKTFYISGHVIPLDVSQGLYAISKNPYSSCYFCGKSGPESVISLKFINKPSKYKLDKVKTFKGTLKLNDTNPMDFIYLFTEAEEFAKVF